MDSVMAKCTVIEGAVFNPPRKGKPRTGFLMNNHRLQPLLKPASIAVLGASQKNGSVGNEVIVNLLRGGFEGLIYPINPGYESVLEITCYASLADLPAPPEMVILLLATGALKRP